MTWLDEDFCKATDREPFLKECLSTKKYIPAGSVLQVSQSLNISVPRRNREVDTSSQSKHDVLKVTLTDGKSSIHGLLAEYHPKLGNSTVPGTKVEIVADVPIMMNFIILTAKNIRVLGGVVPSLVEQYEMQIAVEKMKSWGFRSNNQTSDGPPPWKPFNFRERIDRSELRGVKAMDLVKEQQKDAGKGDDGNKSKFDAQRQEVISELAKQAQSKSFGEGKRLMDKGVLDIMNEGFSQEQAEEAMQRFKNPQKALKHLKGARARSEGKSSVEKETNPRGSKKGRSRDMEEDENGPTGNERGEQPSSSISLFGFIQGKIKTSDEPSGASTETSKPSNDFRYASDDYSDRGSYGNQRDSRSYEGRNGQGRSDRGRPQRQFHDARENPSEYSRGQRGGRGRGGGPRNDRRGRDYGNDDHQYDSGPPSDIHRRQQEPRFARNDRPRQEYGRPQNTGNSNYNSQHSDYPGGFVNQASHFPSLSSDYAPRSAPPPRYQQQQQQQQQQQHQQRSFDDSANYHRNGNERQPYRHQEGQQTYPGRNNRGGYDGYERYRASYRRNDGNNPGDPRMHGHYQNPPSYDQLSHQFSNVSMHGNAGEQFSGDWRPSHTMVFTRSRGK